MLNATRLAAWIAGPLFAFGLLVPTPAHADDAPADCDSANMNAAELAQVDYGMRRFKVNQLVGGPGVRVTDRSSETTLIRQWDWCTDGSYYANQWLEFARDAKGHWVVAEIL